MKLEQILGEEKKHREVDFESDAQTYLSEIQMQIDPHNFVPCDPSGKFSDDCVVIYDDGHYDLEEGQNEEE
jgi:hypothetical protein